MNDQERRENIINALELCTSEIETRTQVPCEKCHYHNKEYHGVLGDGCCNMRSLQRDILALLKAQDVMVMAGAELTDAELIEEIRKAPFVLKPNVDAIPVEWLREKMRGYASALKSTELKALVTVMQMWQKEQEGV